MQRLMSSSRNPDFPMSFCAFIELMEDPHLIPAEIASFIDSNEIPSFAE